MNLKTPSRLTALSGLFFAFGIAIYAIHAQYEAALIALLFAALLNIWRNPKHVVLNRLIAICTYGFAPAIFAYCFGLKGPLSVALLIGYTGVYAIKLSDTDRDERPSSVLLLPLVFTTRFILPDDRVGQILFITYLLMIATLLLNIPARKPKAIVFAVIITILIAIYAWAIWTAMP
ncbi:MAG: hypothetical protein OXH16_20915 [Gemmatimonadetes bacterium]|nr:hypothetical protein [Gemmatimonadota bacterium]